MQGDRADTTAETADPPDSAGGRDVDTAAARDTSGVRDRAADLAGDLAGRRVLVTGSTGFIGAHLCRALAAGGAEVHGVARQVPSPEADLGGGGRTWPADLADAEAAAQVVRSVRPDVVFHLASHVSGDRSLSAIAPTLRDNLISTVNLLTAACEAGGPRVVLAGSMEEPSPTSSAASPAPASPYAAAKAAAGGYARLFHALYDLPVVTLRVFMVYGPAQRDVSKLVPYVTRALLAGEAPHLSSGTRAVDWVYVDDVVAAFVAAATADADAVGGRTLDVGSGVLTTVREVAERVARIVGADESTPVAPIFGAVPDRALETSPSADLGPTRDAIGWRPSTPLDEGLARTVAWHRAQA